MSSEKPVVDAETLFAYNDRTFGSAATAGQINRTLSLAEMATNVPQKGKVLNLGSGIYLGINGLIQLRRPDLSIISVDSGYRMLPPWEGILDLDVNTTFSRKALKKLIKDTRWEDGTVAGTAEALPFADNTFDMAFSHAAIPEWVKPERHHYDAVLGELSRVLKLGAHAVLGPFYDENTDPSWHDAVSDATASGQFAHFETTETSVNVQDRYVLHGHVTRLVR